MKYCKWIVPLGLIAGISGPISPAHAGEGDWSVKSNVQGLYADYSGSALRSGMYSAGVIASVDYLDQGGVTIGATHTSVNFKSRPDIRQQSLFGSLRYTLYPDGLPGALTLRLDGHTINNNDATGNTDHVHVVAPQVSFLSFDKRLYLDLGYARSLYRNNLNVNQYTATLGVGLNSGADWLRARGYYIDPTNAARAQNKNSTSAVELTWKHWFAPDNWLKLDHLVVAGLIGERIYAVDGDAGVVYNLADIQRGSYSLGLKWNLNESSGLLLMAGREYYLDNTIQNPYHSTYVYADVSSHW